MKKIVISLLCIGCISFLPSCTIRTDPGQGKKIGRIVKLSKQGLLFKTWEGELIRGGFSDGTGSMGSSFKFTLKDSTTLIDAIKCFEDQSEVILHYDVEFISFISRSECSQPYFVYKIERLESK